MTTREPKIDVLMATWNGARFLEEQLKSLFRQTFQDFRLMVRDDGSTDSTLQIVEKFRSRYSDRVLVETNSSRKGACRNYSLLIAESTASYVAFCDQDDNWRPDKLELSIAAMKRVEAAEGCDTPVLVFSDMAIVGDELQMIAPSLWRLAHVNPERATLGSMLVQNLVTGCTALANRSLIVKGSPIPEEATMHDTWLGLVAVVFGVLAPLHETAVQYRQHQNNTMGAGRGWWSGNLLKRLRNDQPFKQRIEASRRQSLIFLTRYMDQLTTQQKKTLAVWAHSQHLPAFVRHWRLHRNGLRGTTVFNNLGFLARV